MKYIVSQIVDATQCDTLCNLSVLGSLQLVQNAASCAMEDNGCSNIFGKEKYNAYYVFAKNHLKFFKTIKFREQIRIESFISKCSRVSAFVDTIIFDQNNEIVCYSSLEICALDITTGKIRRLDTAGLDINYPCEKRLVPIDYMVIQPMNLELIETRKIRYTNIDLLHHMNNTEYVRVVLDTYKVSNLENKPIKELEIHYINQCHEDDELQIYKECVENKDLFILKTGNKVVTRIAIVR